MSRRNGDRARFQKERKRKMLRRQAVAEFVTGGTAKPAVKGRDGKRPKPASAKASA